MRAFLGSSVLLGVIACGSPAPMGGFDVATASAGSSDVGAPAASETVGGLSKATGVHLGLVHSANLQGELEPRG